MTTQLPYEPPQYGNYPTAPPWADPAAQPAPPPSPPVAPPAPPSYGSHGQLMVPYPELMRGVGGPTPPSIVPTIVYTFFFGLFGAISAARRADRAARGGNSRRPYWLAFGVTAAAGTILNLIVVAAVAWPAYLDFRERTATKALESGIVHSPPAGKNLPTATEAACVPVGERGADGVRLYQCTFVLSNGRTGTIKVRADLKGNARPVG